MVLLYHLHAGPKHRKVSWLALKDSATTCCTVLAGTESKYKSLLSLGRREAAFLVKYVIIQAWLWSLHGPSNMTEIGSERAESLQPPGCLLSDVSWGSVKQVLGGLQVVRWYSMAVG